MFSLFCKFLGAITSTLALIGMLVGVKASAQALAPGYGDLGYPAPVPGSYHLPIIRQAGDGKVLDSEGRATTLHKLMADVGRSNKVVILGFIYSTCSDLNGCPLATAVFHKVNLHLQKEPVIAKQVKLITLSFNPEQDTFDKMKHFGESLQAKGFDWLFLTTRSEQDLQPILKDYQQSVEKIYDGNGQFTGTFSHNLRVYLIDQHKQIRNIYNTELLHPDILISDIKTLLMPKLTKAKVSQTSPHQSNLYTAGDDKRDYENKTYETQSFALTQRAGQIADLMATIKRPPLGLPPVPAPKVNPISQERINLGRKLFFDRRLSLNNTFSCAMCHIPEQGFTSNEMATAVGLEGRTVRRNSPTLYNVAYQQRLFHDGRESTLEQQVWGPLLAHNEMANPSIGYVIDKIKNSVDYAGLFKSAFNKAAGMETIGIAIANYERTLNSANSAFDRWYFGKQKDALDSKAQRGFQLFTGKAQCSQCHHIGKENALFTDHNFHNTGIGFADALAEKKSPAFKQVQIAPGVYANVPYAVIASVSEAKANDLGRYEITQMPEDRWLYKTPSLRNIALTAPYMHNGSLQSLRDVVEFYNRGGIANENLDQPIKPLHLTNHEVDELTAFLQALTGDNVGELVGDAFAAPVGDVK